ncbi:unnamed protein product [Somion occarium]|uniref:Uncharacterized protein n=1 Tax=Somion occarium TaxID=3059160 RepID=A0ABP1E507_9APHY
MSGISVIQTHLSEKLRLLDELGYSDLGMSYKYVGVHSNKDSRHSETHEDMRILDVIAVCLTTGKPGDVVAAAFDKREHLSLVLAKNGDVLPADYAAAQTFFSDLAAATGWTDLLPFLARHGKENLDKRIRNLHESITHFLDDLQSAIEKYPFGAVEKEFPQSRRYFEVRYPDRQPTVDRILNDLIRTCIDESAFEIQDEKTSYIRFVQLILSATILQRSLFLRELTSNSRYLAIKCRAERLERRLGKVCQYMRIGGLIKRVRRLPSIPIRWVADTFTEMGEGRFELCEDPMEAVERVQEGRTGRGSESSIHAFTPKFVLFFTSADQCYRDRARISGKHNSQLVAANGAASVAHCGSTLSMTTLVCCGRQADLMASRMTTGHFLALQPRWKGLRATWLINASSRMLTIG